MTRLCCLIFFLSLFACSDRTPTLFIPIDSTRTHIAFTNTLPAANGRMSTVDYLYYNMGSGVAILDINNDEKQDIFFMSTQGKNKLYLNLGNFEFEDITDRAGVGGYADWDTGVTIVDINGDGWPDIYTCAVSGLMDLQGSNELYINNGNGTFTEMAASFGLDFSGFASQAAFLDFDHDGDLDMYLVTHDKHNSRSYRRVMASLLPDNKSADILYENIDGKFRPANHWLGGEMKGYSLGIAVADLNNDGWEDMYVTNDFHEPDVCYINQKNGTFNNEAGEKFRHFSRYARGVDIADVNNDTFDDIFTTDISYPSNQPVSENPSWPDYVYQTAYGFQDQFVHNCLHVSECGEHYSDKAFFAGVARTGWSSAPLIADLDNDGWKDIFITTGTGSELNNLSYLKLIENDSFRYAPNLFDSHVREALQHLPSHPLGNFAFQGAPGLQFSDRSSSWGFRDADVSGGAAYVDLDEDGDLDLVVNRLTQPVGIYENRSRQTNKNNYIKIKLQHKDGNTNAIGAQVIIKCGKSMQKAHVNPTRGLFSSLPTELHFGIGAATIIDTLIIRWNEDKTTILTRVACNQSLVVAFDEQTCCAPMPPGFTCTPMVSISDIGDHIYRHKENEFFDFFREGLIPFLVSAEGPAIAVGDVNGDDLEDFYLGGAKYQPGSLWLQDANGTFAVRQQPAFTTDSIYEDVDAVLVDVNNDTYLDLYVVSGGNEFYGKMIQQSDRLYVNDGRGNFSRSKNFPLLYGNKGAVAPTDLDRDGDVDFFVGGRTTPFRYGEDATSFLLINDGSGNFTKSDFEIRGMITDAAWADIERDGDDDLIVTGEWMPPICFENTKGVLTRIEVLDGGDHAFDGLWQCIEVADFDQDGDPDFVAGNIGRNTALYKAEHVLVTKYGDLDNNGTFDQLLGLSDPNGTVQLMNTQSEMEQHFQRDEAATSPAHITTTRRWNEYGGATKTTHEFNSLYFENKGGKFYSKPLPDALQALTLFAFASADLNQDGHLDLVAGGGAQKVHPTFGPFSGNNMCVVFGDGKGNFKEGNIFEKGYFVKEPIRALSTITKGKDRAVLAGTNNGPAKIMTVSHE